MIAVVILLVGIGFLFQMLGVIALHRFPDVYTRMHGATKCTTFGSVFIYLGIILYGIILFLQGQTMYVSLSIHTLIVLFMLLITNPTGAHAIARAAYKSGVKPKHVVVDSLKGVKT